MIHSSTKHENAAEIIADAAPIDCILSAAIRLCMLEKRHREIVQATDFTVAFATEQIEPTYRRIVAARKSLEASVAELQQWSRQRRRDRAENMKGKG